MAISRVVSAVSHYPDLATKSAIQTKSDIQDLSRMADPSRKAALRGQRNLGDP
jgi:hypothetical protein